MPAAIGPLFVNLKKASFATGIPYYRLRRAAKDRTIKTYRPGGRVQYVILSELPQSMPSIATVEAQPSNQMTPDLQSKAPSSTEAELREEWYLVWVLGHGQRVSPQK